MQLRQSYSYTRTITFVLMLLLCIPCTARRALKQLLDIPVATTQPASAPAKPTVCNTDTRSLQTVVSIYRQQQRHPAINTLTYSTSGKVILSPSISTFLYTHHSVVQALYLSYSSLLI